jgi:hypothetical protein
VQPYSPTSLPPAPARSQPSHADQARLSSNPEANSVRQTHVSQLKSAALVKTTCKAVWSREYSFAKVGGRRSPLRFTNDWSEAVTGHGNVIDDRRQRPNCSPSVAQGPAVEQRERRRPTPVRFRGHCHRAIAVITLVLSRVVDGPQIPLGHTSRGEQDARKRYGGRQQ